MATEFITSLRDVDITEWEKRHYKQFIDKQFKKITNDSVFEVIHCGSIQPLPSCSNKYYSEYQVLTQREEKRVIHMLFFSPSIKDLASICIVPSTVGIMTNGCPLPEMDSLVSNWQKDVEFEEGKRQLFFSDLEGLQGVITDNNGEISLGMEKGKFRDEREHRRVMSFTNSFTMSNPANIFSQQRESTKSTNDISSIKEAIKKLGKGDLHAQEELLQVFAKGNQEAYIYVKTLLSDNSYDTNLDMFRYFYQYQDIVGEKIPLLFKLCNDDIKLLRKIMNNLKYNNFFNSSDFKRYMEEQIPFDEYRLIPEYQIAYINRDFKTAGRAEALREKELAHYTLAKPKKDLASVATAVESRINHVMERPY